MNLASSQSAVDAELKARLNRLASGDHRAEDVARIFAGKRFQSFGRASFREIGDFAAHPNERDRGPVTARIQDMLTTFLPMFDRFRGVEPPLDSLLARVESNLRMASTEQIERISFGLGRKKVQQIVASALQKIRLGKIDGLSAEEETLLIAFGDKVIWNPAFRDSEIVDDFTTVVIKNHLIAKADVHKLDTAGPFVVLYAIAAMHGSAYAFGDIRGELQAGFANRYGKLEVTANLSVVGFPKPVSMKVGLLWTDLLGSDYCEEELINTPGPWDFPIELRATKLARIV